MKTPPDRSGIKFEVGAQLEARDPHKKWYPATIERIDYEKEQVLIHYRQWSRRHNEWFQWNSPYLRPLERVSLRRQGLSPLQSTPMFVTGTKVLACWTDCRFYPAKILRVNKDGELLALLLPALLKIVNYLTINFDSQKLSVLVLLDLREAFDTVDHQILLYGYVLFKNP
uniref:Tudor domain-containing protein n=1 Tax=Oryzias latipes TaxID=8090 RepID=A0A3P9K6R7_ORYLA